MSNASNIRSLLLILPCLIISACSETVVKDDPSLTSTGNTASTLPSPQLSTMEPGAESPEMQAAANVSAQFTSEPLLVEPQASATIEISTADTQQSSTGQNPVDNINETTLVNHTEEAADSAQDIEQINDTDDTRTENADETTVDNIGEFTVTMADESQTPEANETAVIATDTEVSVDPLATSIDIAPPLPDVNDSQEPLITNTTGTEQLADPQSGASESASNSTDQVSDPGADQPALAEPATGAPGAVVDCRQTVPCHWTSEDSQFTVSVTNADNVSSAGNLAVQFSISAQHDSQVNIARAEHALDTTGTRYEPLGQALGDGNGITPQTMVAGEILEGTLSFDDVSQDMALAEWSVALIDGGMIRNARFTNIPVGPLTKRPTDCSNALPCVWESPDEQVRITLLSVGNISTGNRLTANFSVETMADSTVALGAGSSAVGTDGTQFTSRTHALAGQTAYETIYADTRAFALLAGSFYFFKSTATPDSLQDLSLVIYEDRPVPRWNPRFTDVPVF